MVIQTLDALAPASRPQRGMGWGGARIGSSCSDERVCVGPYGGGGGAGGHTEGLTDSRGPALVRDWCVPMSLFHSPPFRVFPHRGTRAATAPVLTAPRPSRK